MAAPRLSVVVPTWRRRESVRRLIAALSRQTLSAEAFEAIVAIDGSDDGTREMVEQATTSFTLRALWRPHRGRAAACNAGIAAARGVIVTLLDDDMEPAPCCLAMHLRAHEDGGDRPRAVLGSVPVVLDERATAVTRYVARKFERHLRRLADPEHRFVLRDFYSGNCSFSREVLSGVGGFDEAFTIYGNEDLELSLRLRAAGVELVYRGDAMALQHYDKDFAALARDNVAKGRTAVLLATKHPDAEGGLKLGGDGAGPLRRRAARDLLLALSAASPRVERWVTLSAGRLTRTRATVPNAVLDVLADFYYWRGVRAARAEARGRAPRASGAVRAGGGAGSDA